MIEEMKRTLEQIRRDYELVQTRQAKQAISKEISELKHSIYEAERRQRTILRTKNVDNQIVEIPESMHEYSGLKHHVHDGVLYLIERDKKCRDDGSFSWYSYVWIKKSEDKYTKLCVHMLGGDRHGKRISVSTDHYRHPSDTYGYISRYVRQENQEYRPYIEHILKEVTGWTFASLKKN